MRRVTIVDRMYWKPSNRAGSSQVYEVQALYNLNDKKLEATLQQMNCGFRSSIWKVLHDFKLDKKADQNSYLKYCLDCYYASHTYDYSSATVGARMIEAIRENYPNLKKITP